MRSLTRRRFLATSTAAVAAGVSLAAEPSAKSPASERVRVGIIGVGGRGKNLVETFSKSPQAQVVAMADVDPERLGNALEISEKIQRHRPRGEADFRKLIDDPAIDAVVIATPDHWHAIPTILACQAGKDVYVEKPDGHNIEEGRRMVAAMRKHKRIVQLGSQHRSTERLQSAMQFVQEGGIGRVLVAKAWESSQQGDIGRPADRDPPAGVDYDMWLGSAPLRPFNPNRFHGNWRWFYDYGTGDLGNDGVHRLDMAFALLNAGLVGQGESPVAYPRKVSATGGKWYFDDMQEFPDTLQVTYEFAGTPPKILTYEMRLWAPYVEYGETEGACVYGDKARLIIGNNVWRVIGPKNEVIKEVKGGSHEAPHVENFLDCIKTRQRPYCDLETVGHRASVLCHAGNIATRVGRTLTLDPATESFLDDPEANALRTRPEYRKPWVLPEI